MCHGWYEERAWRARRARRPEPVQEVADPAPDVPEVREPDWALEVDEPERTLEEERVPARI
jgi:hypothetical protein